MLGRRELGRPTLRWEIFWPPLTGLLTSPLPIGSCSILQSAHHNVLVYLALLPLLLRAPPTQHKHC
jgi:hypothetical protein